MTSTVTLADLTALTGLDVLGHLERNMTIPVTGGLQGSTCSVPPPEATRTP